MYVIEKYASTYFLCYSNFKGKELFKREVNINEK